MVLRCSLCGGALLPSRMAPPGLRVMVPTRLGWREFDSCEVCEGEDGPECGGERVPMVLDDDVLCLCSSCRELLEYEEGYQPVCVSDVAEPPVLQFPDSPTR